MWKGREKNKTLFSKINIDCDMKPIIFKVRKGGGAYFLLDGRGVKWDIQRILFANVSAPTKRNKGTSFWVAESDRQEFLREKLKKNLLEQISKLSNQ